ncbi:MAG: NAD(P)/FAD-dependent oxidoreductase [Deltaproteobacteria bacterium]|nr:MAG: NAD(P)/FAD-dependent oxidoreductase [Deltaproteobacteria bacterium]
MSKAQVVDVVIVGAGMAGLAAALWGKRLGLECVVLEQSQQLGGQLHKIHNTIPDYPGLVCDGAGLVTQLESQLNALEIAPRCNAMVQRVDWENQVVVCDEVQFETQALVIATGLEQRRLRVPGSEKWEDAGVYLSYNGHKEEFAGRAACIVGGGDGAFENATMMADECPHITIVYRGTSPRARQSFQEQVDGLSNVEVLYESDVVKVNGEESVTGVEIQGPDGTRSLEVEAVLVKIGMEPRTRWMGENSPKLSKGYLTVDASQQTSLPWVWAVGDVCTPQDPSLSVAAGQACLAMRAIERRLSSV